MKEDKQSVPRWVHVDINSYFATLLQQENPALRRRPVGILKSAGRSCVIAASKEAKKLGIQTGTSASEAKSLAPDIVFLPAEFMRYLDATKRLKKIFSNLVPDYEIFSLDEAFLNLTGCERLYPDARVLGQQVQASIQHELGEFVTSNVGVSWNRFLAKMAGEVAPKGSVNEITPENLNYYLLTTKFSDVCGVGRRLEQRLARLHVHCLYDLHFLSDEDLQQWFGPYWSKELRRMSVGEEPSLFTTHARVQAPKSVSRSITGYALTNNEDEIRSVMRNLIEEVMYKAREMKLSGRWAGLSLSGSGRHWWGHQRVDVPIRHAQELFDILYHQVYQNWHREFPVIRWRIILTDLADWNLSPEPWFPEWHRQEKIEQATQKLNKRFGLFTVRNGTLLKTPIIRPEVTGYLGDRQYVLGD